MTMKTHGNIKYRTGHRLVSGIERFGLQVETWRHEAGRLTDLQLDCTEVGVLLSGQLTVRRTGDGMTQEALGQRGTSWICSAGTYERDIELSAPMEECVHIFLPSGLMERAALEAYDIDPSKAQLRYVGGMNDPLLAQIGETFRTLMNTGLTTTDGLLIDGLRTALAAHLISHYSRDFDRMIEPGAARTLNSARLRRVFELIENHLDADLSLDDLAAEACISPFHFSRLFRESTGLTPHRFVTERRVSTAKEKLAAGHLSLVEIALETGFGSQANFNRVFRKTTGVSPGQFRKGG